MAKKSSKAKKIKERSNVSYIQKIIKSAKTSARGAVHEELNAMMAYVIGNLNCTMGSIFDNYAKTGDTLKSKVVQSALQVTLSGELRDAACNAGAVALAEFIEKNKEKSTKAAEKKKKAIETTAEPGAVAA